MTTKGKNVSTETKIGRNRPKGYQVTHSGTSGLRHKKHGSIGGRVVRERHFVGGGRIPEKGTRRASRR